MRNEKNQNFIKRALAVFSRGAGGLTLGLGSSALILLTTTAIALVAVATTAWIAANRDVNSGTAAMDMDSTLFELSVLSEDGVNKTNTLTHPNWVAGKQGQYNVILGSMLKDLLPGYATGEDQIATGEIDDETGDPITGVVCQLLIDNDDEEEIHSLRPGAYGRLVFELTPKKDNLPFTGTLEVSALGKWLKNSGDVEVEYRRVDEAYFDAYLLENGEADKRADAFRYLKHHVLFFATRSENKDPTGEYTYTNRIAPGGSFSVTGAVTAEQTYVVTIYWVWPRTYDRLTSALGTEEVTAHQTDYCYMKTNDTEPSTGYNNADTEIGLHLSHFAAEITMQAAASPANTPTVAAN